MNLFLSADKNWGIGKDNQLLFRTPGDMARFKRMTLGGVVIMGRKTLESLPGGKPLPGRENIVFTRNPALAAVGFTVVRSLEGLFTLLAPQKENEENFFVIGGEQVYRLLMPYCKRALVTRWDAEAEADSFVPDLDADENWVLLERSAPRTEEDVTYTFLTYLNRAVQAWL